MVSNDSANNVNISVSAYKVVDQVGAFMHSKMFIY